MRSLLRISCIALLAAIGLAPSARAQTDMIVSEYIEGSSNNKAIELFNPTGASIDLAAGGYQLLFYFNGAVAVGGTINLTGVVPSGGTWVVANSSASAGILALADQTSGISFYNGDDAVVLAKGGGATVVDAVGQVGFDPGTEWGAGLVSTADNTLRRNPLVCDGDTNPGDVFDPSIQWSGYATDTIDGLGQHTIACGPTPAAGSTWGAIKTLYR
jgi:predicted extracellular nuclease